MGGLVVAGSDDLRPGLDLHEEVALLQQAGLTPMESLRAATSTAAHALGREDLGVVEVGRLADAVVHDVDPLGPPGSTLHARFVLKGGVVYEAEELLAPFRESYAAMEAALWRARALRGLRLAALLAAAALAVGIAYRRFGASA
jgi:adenine deaminase